MAIPTVAYAPETRWAFGVAGVYYYKIDGARKTSNISFDGAYTLNRQWNVNASLTNYFGDGRWLLQSRVSFRRFPYHYYGVGNRTKLAEKIGYTSDLVNITIQPQCYVSEHWLVGGNVDFRWERPSTTANLDSLRMHFPTNGLDREFFMVGLGVIAAYDNRDEQFYPHRGLFFKTIGTYYEPIFGSTYRMGLISTDLRQFVPIYKDLIFAWQLNTEWAFGQKKPFQYLPTLGGQDIGRGLPRGAWRDDVMINLQAELRIPIWRFLKAAIFASVGDVYNLQHWQWATPKVGYGIGLRAAITKAKVNVRFDVARNNINPSWRTDGWSFYLTVNEAF